MTRPTAHSISLIATFALASASACVGQVPGQNGGDPPTPVDATPGTTHDAWPGAPDAAPPGSPDAALPGTGPGSAVEWIDFSPLNSRTDGSWSSVLTDIAQHCPPDQVDYYMVPGDRVASGHELSHGIHAYIRNNLGSWGDNGLYVLDDKAAVVEEPNIRKSDIIPYIPSRFHGSRYNLYILGQTEWDDTPLYVWDEWNAYINSTTVGIDLAESGMWTGGYQDVCAGPLEFVVYALAVGMAVKDLDPAYFASNDQFREFLAWNTSRALEVVRHCLELDAFGSWQSIDEYYSDLRTHPAGEPIRVFLTSTYGSAFAAEILDL